MAYKRSEYMSEMERLYTQRAFSDIEMAERLETSRNNVYKIRNKMEKKLDIPLYEESRGKYRIDARRRVTTLRVNPSEALALYLGGRRLQQQTRTGQKSVASALEKLAKSLRKPMQASLVRAAKVVLEQEEDKKQAEVLAILIEGWLKRVQVRIKHRKLHGKLRTYTVSPYHLEPAVWGDGIYLIGYSEYHNQVATFKVLRIEGATLLTQPEPFTIPEEFDTQTLLQHAWGIWHADGEPITVRLQFSRHVTPRVMESVWHPLQKITPQEDGGCIWEVQVTEWREMVPWVRGWGADVEVLEPQALRDKLVGEARRLAELYGWKTGRGNVAPEATPSLADTFGDFFGGVS